MLQSGSLWSPCSLPSPREPLPGVREFLKISRRVGMRRLLYSGLLAVTGAIHSPNPPTGPSPVPDTIPQQPAPVNDYRNDPRLHALRRFFAKAGCPAKAYSHVFLEAADDYDLDWRLLPSISF